jgi:hypothetical protein
VAHVVAALNKLWLGLTPSQTCVDTWQLSQLPVTDVCTPAVGFPVTP